MSSRRTEAKTRFVKPASISILKPTGPAVTACEVLHWFKHCSDKLLLYRIIDLPNIELADLDCGRNLDSLLTPQRVQVTPAKTHQASRCPRHTQTTNTCGCVCSVQTTNQNTIMHKTKALICFSLLPAERTTGPPPAQNQWLFANGWSYEPGQRFVWKTLMRDEPSRRLITGCRRNLAAKSSGF